MSHGTSPWIRRVCVAGEGTGATVAAAWPCWPTRWTSGRGRCTAAVRQDEGFFVAAAGIAGVHPPPRKSLQVIGSAEDAQWWGDELKQYSNVGVASEMTARADDPWEVERQEEDAIRAALGLPLHGPVDRAVSFSWRRRHGLTLGPLACVATGGRAGPPVAVVSRPPDLAEVTAIATALAPQHSPRPVCCRSAPVRLAARP